MARDGLNRLSLSAYDDRPFCVGVRIIEKKALEEVRRALPHLLHQMLCDLARKSKYRAKMDFCFWILAAQKDGVLAAHSRQVRIII